VLGVKPNRAREGRNSERDAPDKSRYQFLIYSLFVPVRFARGFYFSLSWVVGGRQNAGNTHSKKSLALLWMVRVYNFCSNQCVLHVGLECYGQMQ
jgi:hypothetical protein